MSTIAKSLLFIICLTLIRAPCQGYLQPFKTPVLEYIKTVEVQEYSGLNLVDCIYVINLDERPKKWEKTEKLLCSFGLTPSRVSAINGWNLSKAAKKPLFGNYGITLRGGQIGCLLSHLSVIADAKKRDFSIAWVCEDDIEILEDPAVLEEVILELSSTDPDWDILFTDINSKNSRGKLIQNELIFARPDQPLFPEAYYRKRIPVSETLERVHFRVGTYSYLISQRGVNKILNYFSHVYLYLPIDLDMHFIPTIRSYCTRREIVSNDWKIPISDTEGQPPKKKAIAGSL